MALQFPSAPQPGDVYPVPTVPGLPSYVWDGNRWAGRQGGTIGPVVNILDYGARAVDYYDNTPHIQAAFDAAFGPASNPHGDTAKNRPVYIPKGRYGIRSPLKLTNVRGGRILGEGRMQAQIMYDGPVGAAGTIVPVLHCDSVCGLEICSLELNMATADRVNVPTPMVCVYWDVTNGPCTDNMVWCVVTSGPHAEGGRYGVRGFLHLSTASSYDNGRTLYIESAVANSDGGFVVSGPKSHDINFIAAGGLQSRPVLRVEDGGHVGVVTALSGNGSYPEIEVFDASGPLAMLACRSESPWYLATNSQINVVAGAQSCLSFNITGSSNGTTLTVDSISQHQIEPGMVVEGGDGVNSYPTTVVGERMHTVILDQLSGGKGGLGTYLTSAPAAPGNISNGTMGVSAQTAVILGTGSVVFDGGVFSYGSNGIGRIRGTAGSSVAIRGTAWMDGYDLADVFSSFAGQITEFAGTPLLLSAVPPPARCKGLTLAVSDSTVAADAATYGQVIQGGGSHVVRAMSDGADWRIA
jgi:hypothetical protein